MAKGVNFWNGPPWSEVATVEDVEGNQREVYRWDGAQWVQIFPAIPDSESSQKLIRRYVLDSVGDGTAEDSEGNQDGIVNGVTSVSGDWAGGAAGDGDGVDHYITTGTWGSFGSGLTGSFAIAFSFSTTDSSGGSLSFIAVELSDGTTLDVQKANRTAMANLSFG